MQPRPGWLTVSAQMQQAFVGSLWTMQPFEVLARVCLLLILSAV